jgi:hypothetical protein
VGPAPEVDLGDQCRLGEHEVLSFRQSGPK